MDNRVSALDQLSAASTALSSSSSHFFNFLTPWSSSNQDGIDFILILFLSFLNFVDCTWTDCDVDRHDSMHLANDTSHERNANYWAYIGICFLLVMLCLSACILWYRMYLLHSNLEYRLASHSSEADREVITWPNSLYSPQVFFSSFSFIISSHWIVWFDVDTDAGASGNIKCPSIVALFERWLERCGEGSNASSVNVIYCQPLWSPWTFSDFLPPSLPPHIIYYKFVISVPAIVYKEEDEEEEEEEEEEEKKREDTGTNFCIFRRKTKMIIWLK